jgi:NADH dehydrogenase
MGDAKRIVVLGGGFGGLYAALHLKDRLKPAEAEIHLVSRTDYFLFTPLLHEVAAGLLEPRGVAKPLRMLLGKRIHFHHADIRRINLADKRVELKGETLAYDTLVIALGSEANYYGLPNVEGQSLPLKTLDDAQALRRHFLDLFRRADGEADPEARGRLLTIVLAGAGCTGVELVAELHHLVTHALVKAYPRLDIKKELRLIVVEATDHLLCPKNMKLADRARDVLKSRHIEIRLETAVVSRDDTGVVVKDMKTGEHSRIPAETLIWTAGISPNRLVRELPVEKDRRGSLLTEPTLQVKGLPDVYAIGDCAAVPGEDGSFAPWTAQAASQQARVAAKNIVAQMEGKPLVPFRYHNMGEVVTLGGTEGISEIFGLRLKGLPGWLAARMAHLARLPDWSDRVRVAAEWGLDFLGPRDTAVPAAPGVDNTDIGA